jgi:hypothetical protein
MYIGSGNTPLYGRDPEDVQISRNWNGAVREIISNTSNGGHAAAETVWQNDLGHYGSVGMSGSGYSDVAFFIPDEFSISGGSTTGSMGFLFDSAGDGIQQQFRWGFRWFGGDAGWDVMRIIHPFGAGRANVIIGAPAPATAHGGALLEIDQNFDGFNDIEVYNQHSSNAAAAGYYAEADSANYIQIIVTSAGAAAYEPTMLRDAAAIRCGGGAGLTNGLILQTDIASPVQIRTNAVQRYIIEGDGKMAWNGGTPVAQPTVTGSKGGNAALASLMAAIGPTGLNLVLDTTT